MIWSFSSHGSFRKCPRQWFYKKVFSSALAKDPTRQEAYRLSKLESVQAWRGKVVDTVISETIIPSVMRKRPVSLSEAKSTADHLFSLQRSQRLAGTGGGAFFEAAYSSPPTEDTFRKAYAEVQAALENFFKARTVWGILSRATMLAPQRTLSFKHGDATVQVRPDLIAFRAQRAPMIFDWKVNARPMRDYWLQLVTGGIALTRCKPHRDWPSGAARYAPHEVELMEVQLLAGYLRMHRVSPADVEEAEDFITMSAGDMQFACGNEDPAKLRPEDFPVTNNPMVCQTCAFRKLCWGPLS